jgi:hypothetical protein
MPKPSSGQSACYKRRPIGNQVGLQKREFNIGSQKGYFAGPSGKIFVIAKEKV